MRMNAAETSASSAIADWTPLAVVPRSLTTAEIDTFISDVSTTRTNIAIASRIASFWLPHDSAETASPEWTVATAVSVLHGLRHAHHPIRTRRRRAVFRGRSALQVSPGLDLTPMNVWLAVYTPSPPKRQNWP